MKKILDSGFELYKIKVQNFLDNPDPQSLPKLVEKIKAAAFMQEITDAEAEYLLSKLPLDINEDIDDGWRPEEINRDTGGINVNNIEQNQGIRQHIKDELDDFEEDEEVEESGFGGLASYSKKQYEYDELDDFEETDEEEEDFGFSGLGNYKRNKENYDELDDFEEDIDDNDDENSHGFLGLL